jgi:GAF domain-containing protein
MQCSQCRNVFVVIGECLNAQVDTVELLERTAKVIAEEFALKGCHFRLLSRDQKILEHVAASGLSQKFLDKGPVDAERSVAEALQGKIVEVKDCSSDTRIQYPVEFQEEGIASMLTIPLRTRGQVIGVMRLMTSEPREFSTEEMEVFKVAALFCTSAIIHSMFHQILDHVTSAIRTSLNLGDVLNSIVHTITEDLRARGCSIRLLDSKGLNLELRASFGLSQEYLDGPSARPGKGVEQALAGQVVTILDAHTDLRIRNQKEMVREGISSILFMPLRFGDKPIGVLSVYTHRPYEFSEEEIQMMTAVCEQCTLAIRNAQMYATLEQRYETVVDDFQLWFEARHAYPPLGRQV